MGNKLQLKRSSVPGKVPTTADLDLGEIAINTYDGKAYMKKNVSGVESIVLLVGAGSGDVVGPASATDNAIARFDTVSGKLIQNSGATIDDNGNLIANSIANKQTTTSTALNVTLTAASNSLQYVGFTADAKKVILPNATTLTVGRSFTIVNNSANLARIALADGYNIITLEAGMSDTVTCVDVSTSNGSWISDNFGKINYKFTDVNETAIAANGIFELLVFPNSNVGVLAYVASADSDLYVRAVTFNADGTTTLSAATLVSAATYIGVSGVALDSGRFLLFPKRSGGQIDVWPVTISGTSFSVGTGVANNFGPADSSTITVDAVKANSTDAIVTWGTATPGEIGTAVYRHNGSTVTWSGQNNRTAAYSPQGQNGQVLSSSRFITFANRTSDYAWGTASYSALTTPVTVTAMAAIGFTWTASTPLDSINLGNNQMMVFANNQIAIANFAADGSSATWCRQGNNAQQMLPEYQSTTLTDQCRARVRKLGAASFGYSSQYMKFYYGKINTTDSSRYYIDAVYGQRLFEIRKSNNLYLQQSVGNDDSSGARSLIGTYYDSSIYLVGIQEI